MICLEKGGHAGSNDKVDDSPARGLPKVEAMDTMIFIRKGDANE